MGVWGDNVVLKCLSHKNEDCTHTDPQYPYKKQAWWNASIARALRREETGQAEPWTLSPV